MRTAKFSRMFPAVLAVLGMALFLIRPARYGESILQGVSVWAVSVLPATFPFLFLTALFTGTPLFSRCAKCIERPFGALFRVSGEGACAAFLAAVSGYPVGARCVLDLKNANRLQEGEAFRLACLATTSGPMFLVGTVGSNMWGRPALGFLLLFCHLFAVYSVSFLLARFAKKPKRMRFHAPAPRDLYDILYSSVISILYVGGSVALFCAFGQMLCDLLPSSLPAWLLSFVRGLTEMTTGCALFAKGGALSLAVSCFFVTFGGACVLCQQLGFLTRAGVKVLPFLAVKLLQALLAAGLCFFLALPLF